MRFRMTLAKNRGIPDVQTHQVRVFCCMSLSGAMLLDLLVLSKRANAKLPVGRGFVFPQRVVVGIFWSIIDSFLQRQDLAEP